MAITLLNPPRFDTRGLPEGMDPERLFQYRHESLSKTAVGLEVFLYKYIPWDLVKSFAFAIDPSHRFKVAPSTITAANRTKYRATASVLNKRSRTDRYYKDTFSPSQNYNGVQVCASPYNNHIVYSPAPFSSGIQTQETLSDKLKDTTSRTRLIGSTQGELEFFKHTLISPPRTQPRNESQRLYVVGLVPSNQCLAVGGTRDELRGFDEYTSRTFAPTAAILSSSVYNALMASELAFCRELSQYNATRLLLNVSPFKREYSLTRNVAELKDLARSMISARRTADDLKQLWSSLSSSPKVRANVFDLASTNVKNIPNEYLSFHFGWKQLYRDLNDLVRLPEKLAKRINFLMSRSAKASTFRAKVTKLSGKTGVSGFSYNTSDTDYNTSQSSRIERVSETRLVINAIFDFPPADVPRLRQRFFADKIGLVPRFTDVYNIIPWSWLVDWFTGFGNYLELVEEINHDPALINWGLITTRTSGKLITEFKSSYRARSTVQFNGVGATTDTFVPVGHTSILEFECQTRANVANALDVNQTTIPTTLSSYQLSILGALLAQRMDNTRPGTFRPRS